MMKKFIIGLLLLSNSSFSSARRLLQDSSLSNSDDRKFPPPPYYIDDEAKFPPSPPPYPPPPFFPEDEEAKFPPSPPPYPDHPDVEPVEGCPKDIRVCPDGEVVTRDPDRDCRFDECANSPSCPEDLKMCNTTFHVIRNPNLDCEFELCPADLPACTRDAYECWDGSFVTRNPLKDCLFDPCPPKEDEIDVCDMEVLHDIKKRIKESDCLDECECNVGYITALIRLSCVIPDDFMENIELIQISSTDECVEIADFKEVLRNHQNVCRSGECDDERDDYDDEKEEDDYDDEKEDYKAPILNMTHTYVMKECLPNCNFEGNVCEMITKLSGHQDVVEATLKECGFNEERCDLGELKRHLEEECDELDGDLGNLFAPTSGAIITGGFLFFLLMI